MALSWDEFTGEVIRVAAGEQAPETGPSITTMDELRTFLMAYHQTGASYRTLFEDERFDAAYAYLLKEDQIRRGHNTQYYENQRVQQAVLQSMLTPLDAMLLHQIEWF